MAPDGRTGLFAEWQYPEGDPKDDFDTISYAALTVNGLKAMRYVSVIRGPNSTLHHTLVVFDRPDAKGRRLTFMFETVEATAADMQPIFETIISSIAVGGASAEGDRPIPRRCRPGQSEASRQADDRQKVLFAGDGLGDTWEDASGNQAAGVVRRCGEIRKRSNARRRPERRRAGVRWGCLPRDRSGSTSSDRGPKTPDLLDRSEGDDRICRRPFDGEGAQDLCGEVGSDCFRRQGNPADIRRLRTGLQSGLADPRQAGLGTGGRRHGAGRGRSFAEARQGRPVRRRPART